MGIVGDMLGFGDDPGETAAEASIRGSEITAEYLREGLEYMKEREALPQEFREGALTRLAGVSGLPGGEGSQQELIDRAIASPLYGELMSGREAGEEAILGSAAATGGLRSGDVQRNLYDYNVQLKNRALLESYNQQLQGLQGLAGLPSLAPQIAGQIGQIGTTLGQGHIAAAQAQQMGGQQQFGNILGLGQLGLSAYQSGMFSDRRLKKNIKLIGEFKGWPWYSWDWGIVAKKMGLSGKTQGIMADEVYVKRPDCVVMKDFFMFVLYGKLGILPEKEAA